jgi:peroxiredoxin
MAATASKMSPLGLQAADFQLPDVVSERQIELSSAVGTKGLLVIFLSRHCPYVQHVKGELARIGREYIPKGIGMVAISANDISKYPDDAPEKLKSMALEEGFNFPVCYDESQQVAQKYQAACTPDYFLYDQNRQLVYRGQLDDSRPGNGKPVTGQSLRRAMDQLLAGETVDQNQYPSLGCNIKWKAGNEPDYFS